MKKKGTRTTYTKQITHPYIFVLELMAFISFFFVLELTAYNYFVVSPASHYQYQMKSTEVQNPRRILHRVAYYANARARKLATPHGYLDSWCCRFSLQHGLAASVGIVLGKAGYC